MKKITICGSMKFFTEIRQLKEELENLGFKVFIPSEEGVDINTFNRLQYLAERPNYIGRDLFIADIS